MGSVLLDTSLYIDALRGGGVATARFRRLTSHATIWLSAVVLEELYAGAVSRDRRLVERLHRDFDKAERLLVPNLDDWVGTGQVLAGVGSHFGYEEIGRGRLTNDMLIAISAARKGITVLTANRRDFSRLAQFYSFQWQIVSSGE